MLVRCSSCSRHVRVGETRCPFCRQRRSTLARRTLAGAAGVAVMTIGIGCAYGLPPDDGDAASDAGDAEVDASIDPDASDGG